MQTVEDEGRRDWRHQDLVLWEENIGPPERGAKVGRHHFSAQVCHPEHQKIKTQNNLYTNREQPGLYCEEYVAGKAEGWLSDLWIPLFTCQSALERDPQLQWLRMRRPASCVEGLQACVSEASYEALWIKQRVFEQACFCMHA